PEARAVDDRRLLRTAVGLVDDDVTVLAELLVVGCSARLIGDDTGPVVGRPAGEAMLLHQEDEIATFHVWLHARTLDGDHRRPEPADREQEEADDRHDRDAREYLTDERDPLLVGVHEPAHACERFPA